MSRPITSVGSLPIEESFADTPLFRSSLHQAESHALNLDASIKNMIQLQTEMSSAMEVYADKQIQFAEELKSFASPQDDMILTAIDQFSSVLKDIERSRSLMNMHIRDVFTTPFSQFQSKELQPIRNLSRGWADANASYDSSMNKYLSKKPKDPGIDECADEAAKDRKFLHRKGVEYCLKLQDMDKRRKFELVENVVALIYTLNAFFHTGFALLKDLEPTMRELTDYLYKMRTDHQNISDTVDSSTFLNTFTQSADGADLYNPAKPIIPAGSPPRHRDSAPSKQGWLHMVKTLGRNNNKTSWVRRYFELKDDTLSYYEDIRETQKSMIDLRICMIRDAFVGERRFCFEIVSPSKTYTLQAYNEYDCKEWITLLQSSVSRALHSNAGSNSSLNTVIATVDGTTQPADTAPDASRQLRDVPGNDQCADCGAPEVEWVSCNLGTLVCINCSGIHRGLGRHISKVRSLLFDRWEPELINMLKALGNQRVNRIFEDRLIRGKAFSITKPTPDSDRVLKEKYISMKYVGKEMVWQPETGSELVLAQAVRNGDLPKALHCLVLNADINELDLYGNTPLHYAVKQNDTSMVEFLLQWRADVNVQDQAKMTPLHIATVTGNMSLVSQLLKRGARPNDKDAEGKTPLDYALDRSGDGDSFVKIVTILRLTIFETEEQQLSVVSKDKYGMSEAMENLSTSGSPSRDSSSPNMNSNNAYNINNNSIMNNNNSITSNMSISSSSPSPRPGIPPRMNSFGLDEQDTSAVWGDSRSNMSSPLRSSTLSPPPSMMTAAHKKVNPEQ
ncbi:hypothetical protein SmJEL517_g03071 [Synchytrium microbalum]|uniref:Arf-GAP with coiled-coil, ANK repeat and PH domain-containing protein n=1 Tax=Synchytrium microbalum TaxID=1806994 RepID=A0A507C3E4_9FUNG|nr:uncharacterized protein SmJEL517_g03071 [Synchytrium microbalum]TPX34182.1 hypothetical protein SmJEL517_g03071 [Synchytrium microbalum]